jgi:hypothetical protein
MSARGGTVDYGVPPAGAIRFFTIPPGTAGPWHIQTIVSHDRTLHEWLELINEWKSGPLPEKYDTSLDVFPLNPFTTRRAAAEFLTNVLMREMRLRWIARRFVARIRERIYNQRIVGIESDLFTTLPIPSDSCVRVRDRESRSLYCFHTNTAKRMIISALNYSQFGIACPQPPKNPYTNRPWTIVQSMVITSQILANDMISMRPHISIDLLRFRKSGHNVETYFEKHKKILMIRGAENFFKDHHNPDYIEICSELLSSLHGMIGYDVCDGWRVVKTLVLGGLLSPELQTRWNDLFCSFWILTNFRYFYKFKKMDDMLEEFMEIHSDSYEFWKAQPKRILRRGERADQDSADL